MSELDANITVFEHDEFGTVRSVMIDGEPWFVGRDVAAALNHANPARAVRDHVPAAHRGVTESVTPDDLHGLDPQTVLISEPGLYRLIMRSNTTKAEEFQEWVTAEVLPQIRKTGQYTRSKSTLELLRDEVDRAIEHEHRMKQIETRQDTMETRVAEVAGDLEWYSAQGWAKLCGHQADQDYLRRVGMRAGKLIRQRGMEPGKVPHPVHATVNTYPPEILREAFIQVDVK